MAACALQYAQPTDDKTAELVISTNAPLAVEFYRDATLCTDMLQVRPPPTIGQTSYRIPADKEFALRFLYYEGGLYSWVACGENIVSFNPEKDQHYVLHYLLEKGVCRWVLTENNGARETAVKVSIRERDPSLTSMGGEGTWCKAKKP
jgi:hypothetical protein